MGTDDLDSQVRTWLENSGRALELRVARDLARGGADAVVQSFHFQDAETGKPREGDVRAEFRWCGANDVRCDLVAVTECKSGRDKPWVAMLDPAPSALGTLDDWVAFAHGPYVGITEPLTDQWEGLSPFALAPIATHVVAALAAEGPNKPNPANDAIRQVLSASSAERQSYTRTQSKPPRGIVIVPVIITEAPLYTCKLIDDELALMRVTSFVTSGSVPGLRRKRVYVFAETEALKFAEAMTKLATIAGS